MMGAEVHPIMTPRKYTGPAVVTPLEYPDPLMALTETPHVGQDVVDKVNAGARLTYAMYLHPEARALFSSPLMTPALRTAYLAAARAWGL